MISPEEQFLSLINHRKDNKDNAVVVSEPEIEKIFGGLKGIKTSFLIGAWNGDGIDTGNPGYKGLKELRWAGKDFRSEDDGDPIMIWDEAGNRVWSEEWGHSSLREMVFRGVISAAMIYDSKPIIDHFRYVDEDTVLGVMDSPKVMGTEHGTFYFFLIRRK